MPETTQRSTVHMCCVSGCTTTIPAKLLMCRAHWALVPAELQDRVYRTSYHASTGGDRGAIDLYRAAVQEARVLVMERIVATAAATGGGPTDDTDAPAAAPVSARAVYEGEGRELLAFLARLAAQADGAWVQVLVGRGSASTSSGRRWLIVSLKERLADGSRLLAIGMDVAPIAMAGRVRFESDVTALRFELGCTGWRRMTDATNGTGVAARFEWRET